MRISRIAGLLAVLLLSNAGLARADQVYATTTGGQLISFDSSTPGALSSNVSVSGVAGSLVGIDFRPAAPDSLYGLGNNGGVGTIYNINLATGFAAPVYTLTMALAGTSFGVDFNPVVDALRILGNTGQNLRITGFATSTFVTNVDGVLNIGSATQSGVVAAAYTNSFAGAATTTLFALQDNATGTPDQLFTVNPPNAGSLTLPTPLSINVSQLSGFDINPANTAFLSWNGGNQFGTINLTTGAAVNNGAVGGGFAGQVTGISVSVVPEPETYALLLAGIAALAARGRRSAGRDPGQQQDAAAKALRV
jgi:hypothetical protein